MGNFFSDLFGGGSSSSSAQRYPTMTKEQQEIFKRLLGQFGGSVGTPSPSYRGQTYAETNPYEQQYMDFISGRTQTPSSQALLNVLQGNPAYDINPEATEQYFQQSVRDPMMKQFRETTMPLLAESFSGPGFWSSGRANATESAVSDLGTSLGTAHGNLLYQDEQARRSALENAMGRQASVALGANQQQADFLGSAGQYARGIEQERIASEISRYLSGEAVNGSFNAAYNPNIQLLLQLLGVQPFTYGTNSTSSGGGGLGSAIGQGLGQYLGSRGFGGGGYGGSGGYGGYGGYGGGGGNSSWYSGGGSTGASTWASGW